MAQKAKAGKKKPPQWKAGMKAMKGGYALKLVKPCKYKNQRGWKVEYMGFSHKMVASVFTRELIAFKMGDVVEPRGLLCHRPFQMPGIKMLEDWTRKQKKGPWSCLPGRDPAQHLLDDNGITSRRGRTRKINAALEVVGDDDVGNDDNGNPGDEIHVNGNIDLLAQDFQQLPNNMIAIVNEANYDEDNDFNLAEVFNNMFDNHVQQLPIGDVVNEPNIGINDDNDIDDDMADAINNLFNNGRFAELIDNAGGFNVPGANEVNRNNLHLIDGIAEIDRNDNAAVDVANATVWAAINPAGGVGAVVDNMMVAMNLRGYDGVVPTAPNVIGANPIDAIHRSGIQNFAADLPVARAPEFAQERPVEMNRKRPAFNDEGPPAQRPRVESGGIWNFLKNWLPL